FQYGCAQPVYLYRTVFHRRYSAFQSGCRCGWHCGIFSRVYWFHRSGQYDLPVAWLCRVRDFCRYGSQSVPDQTRRIQKRCKGLSLKQPTYGCEKAAHQKRWAAENWSAGTDWAGYFPATIFLARTTAGNQEVEVADSRQTAAVHPADCADPMAGWLGCGGVLLPPATAAAVSAAVHEGWFVL